MPVVFLIIVGAAAGFIATRIMRIETDVITTIVIGVAGALAGGLVLRTMLAVMGMFAGLVGAILGAVVLILLWQKIQNK
ncbi:GlsB/YeaQ/YmgE family stress response membrane protein [Tritonibacter mobilis]|uniref:GlsB/YeaQ/YmgE family stress response membrane protein n=1 Tax=Tritonibacter mobilis TaxID=379347 RepID=UPI000D768A74|nr:GlsB/YeaQ/YmgE family stress response membrane protein [Tritonibacter mobilis]NHM17785.1 GlsB/YeaQ/YmgE family stress response membrane protein [Tritonibacter mobilis]NHM21971.1 GlsB/YeaQ/YmgE family stress response membrane protein [Tritonibacter mobilis]PXW84419.1 transglycosylase associated protein [Ruegeria sp. P4]